MPHQTIITPSFIPLDFVRLGRLVLDPDEPQQDYHDPPALDTPSLVTPANPRESFSAYLKKGASASWASKLTTFISASRSTESNASTFVVSDLVQRYSLCNSGSWYKKAIESNETRAWVTDAAKGGDDIYMIVGFDTMTGAVVHEGAAAARKWAAQAELPVGQVLAAAGFQIPGASAANAGGSAGGATTQGLEEQYVVPDEQVCAVQYRKVKWRWLTSKDAEKSELEKSNQWRTPGLVRGGRVGFDEAEKDDILEFELADDDDDLGLDGEYKSFAGGEDGECLLFRYDN